MKFLYPARRYGDTLNSYDVLKLLALLAMVVDHTGQLLFPQALELRAVGRFAFPVFLFLVGYSASWRNKPDILFFAVLVLACAVITHHQILPLNILFSIIFTRMVMKHLDAEGDRLLKPARLMGLYFAALTFFLFVMFAVDYGTMGVLFALCGLLQRRMPGGRLSFCFLLAVMVAHVGLQLVSFSFSLPTGALALVFMVLAFAMLARFSLRQVDVRWIPARVQLLLQWVSSNMLLFYALHICGLMVLEYCLFPARTAHFRWL